MPPDDISANTMGKLQKEQGRILGVNKAHSVHCVQTANHRLRFLNTESNMGMLVEKSNQAFRF